MQRILIACILALLMTSAASAALPAMRGWDVSDTRIISIPQLNEAAGNNAPVVREYGFLGAERREYTRRDERLTVTLWRMVDGTGAYGLFTFLAEPGATVSKQKGGFSASVQGQLLIQRGPYVLEASGDGLTSAATEELAASIPVIEGREALLPPLPAYLPAASSIPKDEKYVIGPVAFGRVVTRIPASAIHFDMGAEASLASYRMGGKNARLLLVGYPTPQMAAKMLNEFQTIPSIADGADDKTLFIERKSSLVAFVFDAPSIETTESLLNSIRYRTDFVWNEYVPAKKENVGGMMLAVFSLAGFVVLVSLFSGLAFGALRLIVKRFVPVPIFDRPSEVEIIRLHLTDP